MCANGSLENKIKVVVDIISELVTVFNPIRAGLKKLISGASHLTITQ